MKRSFAKEKLVGKCFGSLIFLFSLTHCHDSERSVLQESAGSSPNAIEYMAQAEIVALGESIHTSAGYNRIRSDLIKQLVLEKGFRTIAMETPRHLAEQTNRYIQTCEGTPKDALFGVSGVWQDENVMELLEWLCSYNQTHDEKVRFFGFDIQQPWADAPVIKGYLETVENSGGLELSQDLGSCVGINTTTAAEWYSSDAFKNIMNSSKPIGGAEHFSCQSTLEKIKNLAGCNLDDADPDANVCLALISYGAMEAYLYFWNVSTELMMEARDQGMAAVFQTLYEKDWNKAVVWAHNAHISISGYMPLRSEKVRVFGYFLKALYKDQYKSIGLIANKVEINWPGGSPYGTDPLEPRDDSYLETVFSSISKAGSPYLFVDLNSTALINPGQTYKWDNKFAYDDVVLPGAKGVPSEFFDALIYIDHSEAMVQVTP